MTRDGLPFILRQVAERAGLDAALHLARVRGGRRLYVPANPTPDFVAEVGEPAALALSSLYGNEAVSIPLGPHGALNAARRAVDEALRSGASVGEAARRAGLTERAVYKRKAKMADELSSGQGRLFD